MEAMRWMRRLAAAAALALAATAGSAVEVGGVTVLVADDQGRPLPGATVTISHELGYVKTTAVLTDAGGVAEFPVLRSGAGYVLEIAFPGLASVRLDEVRVRIGESERLPVRLSGDIEEQVHVTAERDVIDLDKTEASTKFSDAFLADLPIPGRFYQNMLTMAPGVQDANQDGNPNVHGSRSRDFQVIVNGTSNVDPLTGQWLSQVNPDSIEEIEIISFGAGVEFGRAQGGFARIVQKEGSNTHEGTAKIFWRTSVLDGVGAEDPSAEADPDFDVVQPMVQFSGPIVKDRLWYRLSYEREKGEEPLNVVQSIEIQPKDRETRDALITWQVSPRNKLGLQYRADPDRRGGFGISSTVPPESGEERERDSETWSLTWTAPYSPKVLVTSLAGWQDINTSRGPSDPTALNDCAPDATHEFLRTARCLDLDTQQVSGPFYLTEDDHRQRLTVKSQAKIYGGRLWGATHQFDVGLSIENERYFRHLLRTGSATLDRVDVLPPGDSFGRLLVTLGVPAEDDVRATGTNWALFAEDQIKPLHNLTLTAGLRLDREELNSEGRHVIDPAAELARYEELYPTVPQSQLGTIWPTVFTGYEAFEDFETDLQTIVCKGLGVGDMGQCNALVTQAILSQEHESLAKRRAESLDISNTNVSPYLAVSWSPWSNGKTAFKAAAGRHYNNIPLIVPLQELEPVLTEIGLRKNLESGATTLSGTISPRLSFKAVDRDLDTPYQDELALSFERELWRETALHVSWIQRQFRDQIQDKNVNVDRRDYGSCKLVPVSLTDSVTKVVPSPGTGATVQNLTLQDGTYVYTSDLDGDGVLDVDNQQGDGDGFYDDCAGFDVGVLAGPGGQTQVLGRPDGIQDLYNLHPFFGDIFLIGNFNSIDYEAYVLELVRRQYRGWELSASYTHSRAEGDGEDFFQELANDPSLRDSVAGFQSYDQRDVVKLNATTVTPWGVRLGTAVSWQSGLPFSLVEERVSPDILPPTTELFAAPGARQRQIYVTGQRNDQRNPSYWNVDLNAAYQMRLARGIDLQVSAEVFNVLDDGTLMVYNLDRERGIQLNGENEAIQRFGRQWQLGLKLAF
jgi:outer membrane receptor protein involved in Fe transport